MNYADFITTPGRDCAVIVHRGMWRQAPENSLLSIEKAIAGGYDVVEIDVRRSADGELVLLHDDTLLRMAGIDRMPEEMSAAELASITLRERDGGEGAGLSGEKLPSLKQVFDLARGNIFIHLDVKDRGIIPEVIACTRDMGVDKEVDFWGSIRNQADLDWVRQAIVPHDVLFMAKTRLNVPDGLAQRDLALDLCPRLCEIYFDDLAQLAEHQHLFKQKHISLWVNTLEDVHCAGLTDARALENLEAVWGVLMDAGISAIQTDEPAALKAFIETQQSR